MKKSIYIVYRKFELIRLSSLSSTHFNLSLISFKPGISPKNEIFHSSILKNSLNLKISRK